MANDIDELPEWSRDWARLRQGQHRARGHEASPDEWRGLRDWLASLPHERPRMVGKLHKLTLEQALLASRVWHDAVVAREARIALQRQEYGGDPNAVLVVAGSQLPLKDGVQQGGQGVAQAQQGVESAQQGVESAQQGVELGAQGVALGWHWVKVTSPEGLDYEGAAMGHCVGEGRYDQGCIIYSLRDRDNMPHCTIKYTPDWQRIDQVQGRANAPVAARYHEAVAAFVRALQPLRIEAWGKFGHALADGALLSWKDLKDEVSVEGDFDLSGYDGFQHLPGVMTIQGSASISCNDIKKWSERIVVGQSLRVVMCPLLPDITGILDIGQNLIISSCENLQIISASGRVGSLFSMSHCHKITRLPPNLELLGGILIDCCRNFRDLPQDMNVNASFHIHGCNSLVVLPRTLVVRGELDIRRCTSLEILPSNLDLDGDINITSCNALTDVDVLARANGAVNVSLRYCENLRRLPNNWRVRGNLELACCYGLESLPQGLVVEGDLDLSDCVGLKKLPRDLVVGGNLYLQGAQDIESIPLRLQVGGRIIDPPQGSLGLAYRAMQAVGMRR